MAHDEEEMAYHRLNIVISIDALQKLDKIKEITGLSSRGRTIEELIEAIYDLTYDVRSIDLQIDKYRDENISAEQFVININPFVLSMYRKLIKFAPK